ncbi:hypothetical protein [Microbispora sp. NBRC 16548]|uniref:hypothetical protein n=1 Tax=Microbispora sp. NBRC 16548 TaxID=3030994 RepID=UPI0024A1C55D|nr:hypothetical protein [Microbispora sp. NBRC 16548]GLX06135.1 hypothetical protein Misp03_30620 [Microbispora sp. NBRC 16548]
MSLGTPVSATGSPAAWRDDAFDQLKGFRGLRIMYGTAVRLYRHLLAVCALVLVPPFVALVAVLVALSHRVSFVNGAPVLLVPSPAVLWIFAGLLLTAVVSGFACLAAGSHLVVGHIEGRPLSAGRAVLAVLRRPHAVLLLTVNLVVILAAQAGVIAVVAHATGSIVAVVILGVLLVLLALPAVLAWTALPERIPPLTAAYHLVAYDFWWTIRTIVVAFAAVPVLAQLGLHLLCAALPVPTGVQIGDALRMTVAILLVPFQAAVLGCCYARLHRENQARWGALVIRGDKGGRGRSATATAGAPGGRRTRWWPVGLVLLPGLLYGGYAVAGPLSGVIDNEIAGEDLGWDLGEDGPGPVQIAFGPRGFPIVIRNRGFQEVTFCGDDTCGAQSTVILDASFEEQAGAAVTPDGSVVFAGWVRGAGEIERRELQLFSCRPDGCTWRPGPPLRTAPGDVLRLDVAPVNATAVATRGGIAVASIAPVSADRYPAPARVTLTRCPDLACVHPRTITVGDLTVAGFVTHRKPRALAVAASPDGRPVIAYADLITRKATIAICDTVACGHPATRAFDMPDRSSPRYDPRRSFDDLRLQVAVRSDGRPVIVHNGGGTGDTTIMLCRDPSCSGTPRTVSASELVTLSAPGLALDPVGRPVLAGYDAADPPVAVLFCRDDDCVGRDVTHLIPTSHVGEADVAIGPDRRPRIVWYGTLDGRRAPTYHFLTCADAWCGLRPSPS